MDLDDDSAAGAPILHSGQGAVSSGGDDGDQPQQTGTIEHSDAPDGSDISDASDASESAHDHASAPEHDHLQSAASHDANGAAHLVAQSFGFSVSDGQVTAMTLMDGTRAISLPLPANATFSVDSVTNTVTETIAGQSGTDVIQYVADPANAGVYHLGQETLTYTSPGIADGRGHVEGYSFTLTNGQVTGLQEVSGSTTRAVTHAEDISPATLFAVSGNTVTESSVEGNTVETKVFTLATGSSLYAVASQTTIFVQPGAATTLLAVNPRDRAQFTIDGSGNVTQVQSVSANGTATTVTPDSHTAFQQLDTGFVQETVTAGSHSAYAVFYDGSGGGTYTEVAHGSGSTVDLVGLKAQIAQLPSALAALI